MRANPHFGNTPKKDAVISAGALVTKTAKTARRGRSAKMDKPFKTFVASYVFNGAKWTFTIKAADRDEAQRRIAMLAWAQVDGELICEIPTSLSLVAKATAWVRNKLWEQRDG